jgi:Cu/Ag efflux protein CusF
MKNRLIMALCLMLSAISFALAADKPNLPLVEATITKIDLPAGKVTLTHKAIPNLQMPPMTMPYRVKDINELKPLHEGDKVKFTADKIKEGYTVMHIEIAK